MNLAMNLDSYDHNLITIDQLATKANQKRGKSTAEQFNFCLASSYHKLAIDLQ